MKDKEKPKYYQITIIILSVVICYIMIMAVSLDYQGYRIRKECQCEKQSPCINVLNCTDDCTAQIEIITQKLRNKIDQAHLILEDAIRDINLKRLK